MAFFRNYYGVDNPHTPSCDQNDYTPYIDNVYLNTLPKGIDDNILIKSITDLSSRTQIAKILSSYSDDQVSGFDGVLFYAMKDNKLFIYTFDSKAPGHIFTNELNVDGIISYKLLGRSICQSIRSKILPSQSLMILRSVALFRYFSLIICMLCFSSAIAGEMFSVSIPLNL
ncbi:Uncharacterised protein [Klebsiella pneumoniae subsp. ozaenae]|uniref:Uncharacterized protein n=1 Tax=Klebsiella pneumoniae subsp. ozaenae TaxID=574 RepID=A0A377ZHM4_KLEPO|nr:Uncharacterised protein [Klebsiella pneumoniae subsp. ozaenae]